MCLFYFQLFNKLSYSAVRRATFHVFVLLSVVQQALVLCCPACHVPCVCFTFSCSTNSRTLLSGVPRSMCLFYFQLFNKLSYSAVRRATFHVFVLLSVVQQALVLCCPACHVPCVCFTFSCSTSSRTLLSGVPRSMCLFYFQLFNKLSYSAVRHATFHVFVLLAVVQQALVLCCPACHVPCVCFTFSCSTSSRTLLSGVPRSMCLFYFQLFNKLSYSAVRRATFHVFVLLSVVQQALVLCCPACHVPCVLAHAAQFPRFPRTLSQGKTLQTYNNSWLFYHPVDCSGQGKTLQTYNNSWLFYHPVDCSGHGKTHCRHTITAGSSITLLTAVVMVHYFIFYCLL